MSLDVHLEGPGGESTGIFIRENGRIREISREEWDQKFPGREPVVAKSSEDLYWANITHNLSKMAKESGLYIPLWRPEEAGYKYAEDLIEPIASGLATLRADPAKFKQYNPENGWGNYDDLLRFAKEYLDACWKFPAAMIRVSR